MLHRGNILPLLAIGILAVLGTTALTIDVGRMAATKSGLQNAVDAAAVAGAGRLPTALDAQDAAALFYQTNRTGSAAQPAGTGTVTRTYNVNGDAIAVTTPYSDDYTTLMQYDPTECVEVRVTQNLRLPFAAVLGLGSTSIGGRAVGWARSGTTDRKWGAGDGCLFAKDQGFALSCNTFKVKGSVVSNSNIGISVNNVSVGNTLHAKTTCNISGNQLNGHFNLEYGSTYSVSCNHADIASYAKVPQVDLTPPINYDPANWNTDFHPAVYYNSTVNMSASNIKWPSGTYYVNGDLNISANNVDLRDTTFIVNGTVNISTNNLQLSYHENNMMFYILGSGSININQNNVTVIGDLYAPNGYINCSSNNVHQGWWVARRISVSCNNFELDGIASRTAFTTALKLVE